MRKALSTPAIVFKGSGWAKKDHRDKVHAASTAAAKTTAAEAPAGSAATPAEGPGSTAAAPSAASGGLGRGRDHHRRGHSVCDPGGNEGLVGEPRLSPAVRRGDRVSPEAAA